MKTTCIPSLLALGGLLVFSSGISGGEKFRAFEQQLNYTEAHTACVSERDALYLAIIRNTSDLLLAKSKVNAADGIKYWTGLSAFKNNWELSDGRTPRFAAYKVVKNASYVSGLWSLIDKLCCMVTSYPLLECGNCSEKHPYICEGFRVNTPLIDLTFALSATSSSSNNTFALMKKTVLAIIQQYGIDRIRYTVFVFGSDAQICVAFARMPKKDSLALLITSLKKRSGIPDLFKVLKQAKQGYQQLDVRSNASRVVVVMLDNKPVNNTSELSEVLSDLNNKGVLIINVGVGNLVDKTDLSTIVKDERHVITVGINESSEELAREIMHVIHSALANLSSAETESIPTATQMQATPTIPLASQVTATATSKETHTTTIMASKPSSIFTDVFTSITPTEPINTQEEKIEEYVAKMKRLRVDDENSLQTAVNETSQLLIVFEDISNKESHKTKANLLVAAQQLEYFALKYAEKHLLTNGTYNSTTVSTGQHLVMEVQIMNAGYKKEVSFPSEDVQEQLPGDYNLLNDRMILPPNLFEQQETVVVGIVYQDLHELLPDESQYILDGMKMKNTKLQTRIIACSLSPPPPSEIEENVTISFTLHEPSKPEDKPHCVFWDFDVTSQFNGSWSSRGCSLVNKTERKVMCSCNHLTNFAVLMQLGETKIAPKHQLALEIITYIGCGLSLMGEFLTIVAYLVLMNLKQEQCQIRLNLVAAIAVAQILYLAGINATSELGICIFVAVSIHYFYLAGFAWMLMEGIYLYLMVVKVFNTLVRIKLFYAISWGFPLLMVISSIVIASGSDDGIKSYVHGDFCWVSFSNNLVWTFAAPVLLVCLVNSFILCRVVYEMTRMHSTKDTSNVKQGLKACVVLFPLLGLTWVFGILSVTDAGLVFQYIFTILNSLQGFFIFIIHVLRSSDVRTAYLRKKQKWDNSKNSNFPSSRSVVDNSSAWLENHDMNNLSRNTDNPDPTFRRHQVSPINSDRMDTRESCITPVSS